MTFRRFHSVALSMTLLSATASGCITVSPPTFSLDSLKKSKASRLAYEEPVEEVPQIENPTQVKLAYARLMEDVGQFVEARRHYGEISKEQPKNVDALLGLARLDMLVGEYEAAEVALKKAVKLAPDSPAAQSALGALYANQGDWSRAVDPLTKAMLAAPQDSHHRFQLAVALTRCGDVDSAMPHFIRSVGDAEAHYNVGLILYETGRVDEAERHFQIAVAKKPELTQARTWLTHLRPDATANGSASVIAADAAAPAASAVKTAGHSAATPPSRSIPAPRQPSPQQLEQMRNQQSSAGR